MRFRRPRPIPASRRHRRGFTLIEASLTIIIVGIGVLAAAELLAIGTKQNADSHRLTTGLNLAASVREMAQQKTGAEVLAMDGSTYAPARDARGAAIPGLDSWSQVVSVTRVAPGLITTPGGNDSRLMNLAVTVRYRGEVVTSESWLLADTSE